MKNLSIIKDSIRSIPDFPSAGIMFRDVTTLMKDSLAYKTSCYCMEKSAREFPEFDFLAGIESRGFVFGSVIAEKMNKGLVLVRKPGKLPAEVLSMDYELEYGKDTVEVHVDAIKPGNRYLVVDDLLATGGTADASCRLIEKGGGIIVGCLFLVELPDLGGRKKLMHRKVESIVQFEGE
ncbi:adenine phosphoribosyltransferase [Bacteroidota bacterium]